MLNLCQHTPASAFGAEGGLSVWVSSQCEGRVFEGVVLCACLGNG